MGTGGMGTGTGAGADRGSGTVPSPCSDSSRSSVPQPMTNDPPTPHPVPHELSRNTVWARGSTPRATISWPPRTDASGEMTTSPDAVGVSNESYQLQPSMTGPVWRAAVKSARDRQCVYPEMNPAFVAACATDRPELPLSFGGYGPSPSIVSAAEYSLTAPASFRTVPAGRAANSGSEPRAPSSALPVQDPTWPWSRIGMWRLCSTSASSRPSCWYR